MIADATLTQKVIGSHFATSFIRSFFLWSGILWITPFFVFINVVPDSPALHRKEPLITENTQYIVLEQIFFSIY